MKKINSTFVAFLLCFGVFTNSLQSMEAPTEKGVKETKGRSYWLRKLNADVREINAENELTKAEIEKNILYERRKSFCLFVLLGGGLLYDPMVASKLGMGYVFITSMKNMEKLITSWDKENDRLEAQYKIEYDKNAAMYQDMSGFTQSEFPEKIEERIDALINQQYTNTENESFDIFSTPRSKIFVLQNIEDFFELQKGDEFKNFNLTVYEVCTKKINELEKVATSENDRLIDTAHSNYMKEFGISTSTLKNMTSAQLDKKISQVKESMNQLVEDLVNKKKLINRDTDAQMRALWSIFVHLYYKQSQKREMFVGEGLTQEWRKPVDVQIEPNLTGITLATPKTAAAQALQKRQEKHKVWEAQQSIFSKMRSAWNSWWYGSK